MSRNLNSPYFPHPPAEYSQRYFSEILRSFSLSLDQSRAPGEGRWTKGTFTQLPTSAAGLENGALFSENDYVRVAPGSGVTPASLLKAYGSSTASIANTTADVTWSAASITSTDCSVSGAAITITNAGVYVFTVSVRTDNDNRTELILHTYIDTGSGYVEQTSDIASDYVSRDIDQDTGGLTFVTAFDLAASDVVKFVAEGDCDGTSTLKTEGTILLVERKS